MWEDAEVRSPSPGTTAESALDHDISTSLLEELQPHLSPLGVTPGHLARIIKAALKEVDEKARPACATADAPRSSLQALVLWKIFARGSGLWIGFRTETGNEVTLDLLVAGYSVWRSALNLAARQNIDAAAAADALVQVTHATADQLARIEQDSSREEIRDLRAYVFASFMHAISEIAERQGLRRTEYIDMASWIADREVSDHGAFIGALEDGILCRELLEAMPPKGMSVAISRYILGHSWKETADETGSSVNTSQKALSVGIKRALGICMSELRKMGCRKVAHMESYLTKKNRRLKDKR